MLKRQIYIPAAQEPRSASCSLFWGYSEGGFAPIVFVGWAQMTLNQSTGGTFYSCDRFMDWQTGVHSEHSFPKTGQHPMFVSIIKLKLTFHLLPYHMQLQIFKLNYEAMHKFTYITD